MFERLQRKSCHLSITGGLVAGGGDTGGQIQEVAPGIQDNGREKFMLALWGAAVLAKALGWNR